MAGSFGFESDAGKREVARACGERVLFPAIRAMPAEALLVANGFSCRTQIARGTGKRALHLAEIMKLAIDFGPAGPPDEPAEERESGVERRPRSPKSTILLLLALIGVVWFIVSKSW